MSEYSQFFRVYGQSRDELTSLLADIFPKYSFQEGKAQQIQLIPSAEKIQQLKQDELEMYGFDLEKPDDSYQFFFNLKEETHPELFSFDTWLIGSNIEFSDILNKRKWTYLSYGYCTGAGWDELQIYQKGKLQYTENAGEEFIQFGKKTYELELGSGTIQEKCLQSLWISLGKANILIEGWEDPVKKGEFLSEILPCT